MLEVKEVVELELSGDQMYSYHSYDYELTGCHHVLSPVHPDSGPIVCCVSYRRSKDVKGRTIGISISLLALMADSKDRRARATLSEVKEVCRTRLSTPCGLLGITSLLS
jgi:hypothetical protein